MTLTIILVLTVHTILSALAPTQSSDLVGKWKLEVTFENKSPVSFLFEAQDSGAGSLVLERPKSTWDEPAKPSAAKWLSGSAKQVTIFGPVEFPIGNVGREPGTLVFKGIFQSERSITGEIEFFLQGQDPRDPRSSPSRTGKFKATRLGAP